MALWRLAPTKLLPVRQACCLMGARLAWGEGERTTVHDLAQRKQPHEGEESVHPDRIKRGQPMPPPEAELMKMVEYGMSDSEGGYRDSERGSAADKGMSSYESADEYPSAQE